METNLEFRKIPSLKFLYEISEDGRIVRNVKSKHQIKVTLDKHHSKSGCYAFWTFVTLDGVKKIRRHMVHKVVAECWHGPCPEGLEIDHIDRNSHNNHFSNLRYVNHSEQMRNRKLGDHVIAQATENCRKWNESISVRVGLSVPDEPGSLEMKSIAEAARFISDVYDVPFEHVRFKLKKRRSHIFDYDVSYWNAETERRRP